MIEVERDRVKELGRELQEARAQIEFEQNAHIQTRDYMQSELRAVEKERAAAEARVKELEAERDGWLKRIRANNETYDHMAKELRIYRDQLATAEADCVSLREALEEHRTRHLQEGGIHHHRRAIEEKK